MANEMMNKIMDMFGSSHQWGQTNNSSFITFLINENQHLKTELGQHKIAADRRNQELVQEVARLNKKLKDYKTKLTSQATVSQGISAFYGSPATVSPAISTPLRSAEAQSRPAEMQSRPAETQSRLAEVQTQAAVSQASLQPTHDYLASLYDPLTVSQGISTFSGSPATMSPAISTPLRSAEAQSRPAETQSRPAETQSRLAEVQTQAAITQASQQTTHDYLASLYEPLTASQGISTFLGSSVTMSPAISTPLRSAEAQSRPAETQSRPAEVQTQAAITQASQQTTHNYLRSLYEPATISQTASKLAVSQVRSTSTPIVPKVTSSQGANYIPTPINQLFTKSVDGATPTPSSTSTKFTSETLEYHPSPIHQFRRKRRTDGKESQSKMAKVGPSKRIKTPCLNDAYISISEDEN